MFKIIVISFMLLYLDIGLYFGLRTKENVPDTNALGIGFVMITWPAWVKGSPIPEPDVPSWCFTINKDED